MNDQDVERWKKLVADFEASDLTQREFASERGLSFSNLRNWIYRLRKESRPLVEVAPESSRLVPVRVVASAPKARLGEMSVSPRRAPCSPDYFFGGAWATARSETSPSPRSRNSHSPTRRRSLG